MQIGQTFGPYQILAKAGKGGMGEVYRARDTKLGRDVALKILADEYTQDPDRIRRPNAAIGRPVTTRNSSSIRIERMSRRDIGISGQLYGQPHARGCHASVTRWSRSHRGVIAQPRLASGELAAVVERDLEPAAYVKTGIHSIREARLAQRSAEALKNRAGIRRPHVELR